IANFLKRSVSSISEEIKQGKDKYGKYNPVLADRRSIKKAKSRRFGKRKINKKEVAKQTKITKI
ncbi:MAG: hypothetical protein LRZ98_01015, partial [Candidatus Pacebacteria bacterium]|nr:hypothetical protein [Candidatus Paceibacterota bacterium]